MVREYGMSELGLVTYERERRPLFLNVDMGETGRTVSEATAEEIDRQVKKIVEAARERTQAILTGHQDKLRALAQRLLEKEVVERDELQDILGPPASESPSGQEIRPELTSKGGAA
jgi:cell division protease FtsH